MNKLPIETRAQILQMLCEGSSMRSISRVCGVSINTVSKLLVDAGNACASFHAGEVRNVKSKRVQCDEIWSFCYSKQNNTEVADRRKGRGDVWTWTAIDADTKLIVSWMVGNRDAETARIFMQDVADRLANRVQLTTDGYRPYLDAVKGAFQGNIDYAMLVKLYGEDRSIPRSSERRYSPSEIIGTRVETITGAPNAHYTSTSFAERQNLTMRMSMRRFTRLTNAFSKKFDNHCHALSLYFTWYNWVRVHSTVEATPAMAAGLIDRPMTWEEIIAVIEAEQPAKVAA